MTLKVLPPTGLRFYSFPDHLRTDHLSTLPTNGLYSSQECGLVVAPWCLFVLFNFGYITRWSSPLGWMLLKTGDCQLYFAQERVSEQEHPVKKLQYQRQLTHQGVAWHDRAGSPRKTRWS